MGGGAEQERRPSRSVQRLTEMALGPGSRRRARSRSRAGRSARRPPGAASASQLRARDRTRSRRAAASPGRRARAARPSVRRGRPSGRRARAPAAAATGAAAAASSRPRRRRGSRGQARWSKAVTSGQGVGGWEESGGGATSHRPRPGRCHGGDGERAPAEGLQSARRLAGQGGVRALGEDLQGRAPTRGRYRLGQRAGGDRAQQVGALLLLGARGDGGGGSTRSCLRSASAGSTRSWRGSSRGGDVTVAGGEQLLEPRHPAGQDLACEVEDGEGTRRGPSASPAVPGSPAGPGRGATTCLRSEPALLGERGESLRPGGGPARSAHGPGPAPPGRRASALRADVAGTSCWSGRGDLALLPGHRRGHRQHPALDERHADGRRQVVGVHRLAQDVIHRLAQAPGVGPRRDLVGRRHEVLAPLPPLDGPRAGRPAGAAGCVATPTAATWPPTREGRASRTGRLPAARPGPSVS